MKVLTKTADTALTSKQSVWDFTRNTPKNLWNLAEHITASATRSVSNQSLTKTVFTPTTNIAVISLLKKQRQELQQASLTS